MSFIPAELIRKKRAGLEHTHQEIAYLIQNFTSGALPDYQMSAWLMAVCFQGMTDNETSSLTEMMIQSGETLNFSHLPVMAVDKHSTGGIGDKTSLILAPLVAAAGVPVPMMAGRGLGHSGGTVDKLESIPGYVTQLDLKKFRSQVEKIGCSIIGQTKSICPADLKIYALRDVSGTVESIPLICGSIMSKKLAEGVGGLVLEVKTGTGAFMKKIEDARQLARGLVQIGHLRGHKTIGLITDMNQPLGRFGGNACEVQECLDLMQGRQDPADTLELTLTLAAHMIVTAGAAPDLAAARAQCQKLLKSGVVLKKFVEMCEAQGANPGWKLPQASHERVFTAPASGFMDYLDVEAIGYALIELGAGRRRSVDAIDHSAGMEFLKKRGDAVAAGEPLIRLFTNKESAFDSALARLKPAIHVVETTPVTNPLIVETITPQGAPHERR